MTAVKTHTQKVCIIIDGLLFPIYGVIHSTCNWWFIWPYQLVNLKGILSSE